MTRDAMMQRIEALNKEKMYEMIDAFPDVVIANEFKRYLFKHKEEVPKSNELGKIISIGQRIIQDLKAKYFSPN